MTDQIGKETLEIMSNVRWYNEWLFKLMEKSIRGKILEVGAGIGNFTSLLAKMGKVYAIDYDKDYIKNLKNELPDIKIGYGDIEKGKHQFDKDKFDTIICLNVLEHIRNDKKALENMYQLQRKKGKLILLVPAFNVAYGKFDKNLGHFRRYNIAELKKLLESVNYEVVEAKYLNMLGFIGWFGNRILKRNKFPKYQLVIFNLFARPFIFLEKFFNPPFGLSAFVIATRK